MKPALLAMMVGMSFQSCSVYQFKSGPPSVYRSNESTDALDSARPLVGVAISGGGNRSALFASYVLELLGSLPVEVLAPANATTPRQTSFLDTIGYISSVSGGGFAASYFGMKGLGRYDALVSGGTVPKTYTDFFDGFHTTMNFDWAGTALGLEGLTFGSTETRLSKVIDSQFLDGATFADLDQHEASGTAPYLIFNATHYDSGRRFVMTTIPSSNFCLNTEQLLKDVVYASGNQQYKIDPMYLQKIAQCDRKDPLTPEGFDSFSNPRMTSVPSTSFPISRAVATSASFPLAIGPVAYQIDDDKAYLHLIDGGVADNSGVESITQLFLRKLIKNTQSRGLIVALDAGLPFNSRGTTIADARLPVSTIIKDPARLSDIQEVRASLYRQDLWEVTEAVAKNMKKSSNAVTRLDIEQLQHIDLNVGSLRIDAGECHEQLTDAKSVRDAVRDIPTNFHLDACSTQLVRIAACWSVHQHAAAIQHLVDNLDGNDRKRSPDTSILDKRARAMCPELVSAGNL